ncbi:MAG: PA2779 family protein [Acidobacteriota bacterium]
MHSHIRQSARLLTAAVLAALMGYTQTARAQATQHLVSPQELHNATQGATQTRLQDQKTLRDFLSSPEAQKALQSAHMNPEQVQNATASLSDHELSQLAARARNAQSDFAAGSLNDHDLLIILIAIAALILIIVAVH